MARTALTPITSTRAGVALTYSAANADGHSIANTAERVMLLVNNGSASAITVTFDVPKTVDGNAVADLTGTVAAGAVKMFGPFPMALYNQTASAVVNVDFSAVATVTVAAVILGSAAY